MQHSSASAGEPIPTPEQAAGREVRRLRTARGWSQEQVAERMKAYGYDWHQTLIGRIEAAQRPLRLNEAADLATLFGVPLEQLAQPDPGLDPDEAEARIAHVEMRLRDAEQHATAVREQEAHTAASLAKVRQEQQHAEAVVSALLSELDVLHKLRGSSS